MNIVDENIVAAQRELLRSWKIHFRRAILDTVWSFLMSSLTKQLTLSVNSYDTALFARGHSVWEKLSMSLTAE